MTKRTTYTKEFKLEAIRLLEAGDKPGTQIARELGIRRKARGSGLNGTALGSKLHELRA